MNQFSKSIEINTSSISSSTPSTDDSSSSSLIHLTNKLRFFHRIMTIRNSSKKKTFNSQSIIVHFLDDTQRTFTIDRYCKGIDLFNEIADYLNLSEQRKYFGLLIENFNDDFPYRWLDLNKILRKQIIINQSLYHLHFKVRFFLSNPSIDINDEYIKYLYVLQIKKDFLSGKIWCSRTIASVLASYIIQSELGDYNANEHQLGYLHDFRFVPFQNLDFENNVQHYHQQHRGQTPAEAESNYLRIASTLDMYGVELHKTSVKVSNMKKSLLNSTVELYVGVCAKGIAVFQNSTKINLFSWDQITKISFKRRTFYVELSKNENENSIVFTLRNYHSCKYLWKSCVDHHRFFRLTPILSSPILSSHVKSFERISSRRKIHSTINLTIPKSPPPKPPRQILSTNRIQLKSDIDGRYGFNIKKDDDNLIITKITSNTPASRTNLHQGDIILTINNIDIRYHSYDDIINIIRNSEQLELIIQERNSLKYSLENIRLNLSFEQFETLSRRKETFTFEIASQQSNFYHNRYKDVLPYDQTRVILKNDYINANHIDIPIISTDIVNRYIATQGPLPNTCQIFWQMIWEQKCCLIIMLTPLFENGRIKCHQYWPNVLETNDYNDFTIHCTRERKENELIYREFIFMNKNTNDKRIIYQIQNETWPDHGIPNDYHSFINFILEIRELRKANEHLPILVHCSAGIGRTGVLILVETALCLIETNQPIFPLDIVRQMREQRFGMIQTFNQYQFACQAILYAYDQRLIETITQCQI